MRRPRSSAASTYGAERTTRRRRAVVRDQHDAVLGSGHTDVQRTTAIDLDGELGDVHGVVAYAVIALTSASKLST